MLELAYAYVWRVFVAAEQIAFSEVALKWQQLHEFGRSLNIHGQIQVNFRCRKVLGGV